MAVTEAIQLGPPVSLAQNVIFALPPRACRVLSSQVLEVTSGTLGGTYAAVAATTTGTDIVGTFVKNTNATTAVAVFRNY